MGLKFEAWTLPTSAVFEKKFDIPQVLAGATGVREMSAWTDASMPVPASWDGIDDLIAEDDASLVAVFNGTSLVDEFIAQRCPFSTTRPSIRTVSGPGINGIVEKCGVYALTDGVDDWIWGSEVNILSNPGFEENSITSAVWELQITATGGTYTITDGIDTTAAIAFDAQASTIHTRLQNDIAAIVDVIVVGTSINPYNRTITFLTPPFGVSLFINTGALTGGAGTLIVDEPGGQEVAAWTNARSITVTGGLAHYDAFEVSSVRARSGFWSLLIDPGIIFPLSARGPGIQQIVGVNPSQTYQASGWIWPTSATDRFRLAVVTPGEEIVAAGSGVTLTPNQWNQLVLNDIVIPSGARQVILRAQVTNSGTYNPSAAWYDDFELLEGMPAASVQAILDQLLSAAHARGTFGFLEIDALTDEDTNGNALADVAFAAWYGQDLGHVLDGLHALGYNWRIVRADQAQQITPTGTHVLQVFNIGTSPTDHTATPGGPSVTSGGKIEAGEVVKRVPEFTAVRARGLGDLAVDDTNATALANMGRWEKIVDAENITSETALQLLINAAFAAEDLNQVAATATVLDTDPSQPLIRFDAGDRIWWQYPGFLPKEARPVKRISWIHGIPARYEIQGSKVLSGDASIAKAVDHLLRLFQRRRRGGDGLKASDVALLAPQQTGAHIHLVRSSTQSLDAGAPVALVWTATNPVHPAMNFRDLSFPTSTIEIQQAGYYDIEVAFALASAYMSGGSVTIIRNGFSTVWPPSVDMDIWTTGNGRRFAGTAKGVDLQSDDTIEVHVEHNDGSAVDLEWAQCSIELIDRVIKIQHESIPTPDLLWLDGADLSSAGSLSSWNDKSGANNSVSQATGASQPTVVLAELSGRPVVRFDGTEDRLSTALFTTSAQPITIIAVAKNTGTSPWSNYRELISCDPTGSARSAEIGIAASTGNWYIGDASGNHVEGSPADTNWHVFEAVLDGASSLLVVDGSQDAAGNASDVGFVDDLHVGGRFTDYWQGDIAEIRAFSRALTDTERGHVRTDLTTKWGL